MSEKRGFTLIELLIGLSISAIVLAGVMTMASALSSAEQYAGDRSEKQAGLRYTSLHLSDLIRNCRLVTGFNDGDLGIWQADENEDGSININEMVYVQPVETENCIKVCSFDSATNPSIGLGQSQTLNKAGYSPVYTEILSGCSNISFDLHGQSPPATKRVTLSFELSINDIRNYYEITATLRAHAGHLLDESGTMIVSDDDE